nr:protein tweety homolog 2-like [Aotus nancymaae]
MQAARVEYIAPWWVVWLHSVPHLGLRLQPVDSTFSPGDESYQESLLFLALVAAVCLGLNLIFLAAYLVGVCCCRQEDAAQTKQRQSCCITWTAVVAGLVCCAAVGVGFYGNSETNDGVYQLMYSLEDANHTFSGIDALVRLPGSWPGTGTAHKASVVRARAPSDPSGSAERGGPVCCPRAGPRSVLQLPLLGQMGNCAFQAWRGGRDGGRTKGGSCGIKPHSFSGKLNELLPTGQRRP